MTSFKMLTKQYLQVYKPQESHTYDEKRCAFQGCTFFYVYMKWKPHRYGIKILELC
jgi:hypothetical protein